MNRPALLIIAGALVCAALVAPPLWTHLHETPPAAPPPLRLALPVAESLSLGAGREHTFEFALSPDGRRGAFPAARGTERAIWVRQLTTGEVAALPGTTDGVLPFWSPDASQLGFFADGKLKAFAFATGQTRELAEAPAPRGGAWHSAGDIIFAPRADAGLSLYRAADKTVSSLTNVDSAHGEVFHGYPTLLADAKCVLFFVRASEATRQGVWIGALDDMRSRVRLAGGESNAIAFGNWILYETGGALVTQQLTGLASGEAPSLVGRAILLATNVGRSPLNQLSASVGGDALIYGSFESERRDLRWFDRMGRAAGTLATGIDAWDVRIAPRVGGRTMHDSGRQSARVAVTQLDAQLGTIDVFMYEAGRPLPQRISQSIDVDETPAWSSDAARLAWVQRRRSLMIRGVQRQLPEQPLRQFDVPVRLWDWTRDARRFMIGMTRPGTKDDLFVVAASANPSTLELSPYAQSAFNETQAAVAPDGRWIAYASDESGRPEIYVDAFPAPRHRIRATDGGASEPRWSEHGDELYFRRGSEIHALIVTRNADSLEASSSTRLFDAGSDIRSYDSAPDGSRFLLNVAAPRSKAPSITVIVNWQSLLPSLPPGGHQ